MLNYILIRIRKILLLLFIQNRPKIAVSVYLHFQATSPKRIRIIATRRRDTLKPGNTAVKRNCRSATN